MAERLKGEDAYDSAIRLIAEGRAKTEDGAREAIRLLEGALRDGIPLRDQAIAFKWLGDKYIIASNNFQASYNYYKKALTIRKTLTVSEEDEKFIWQHAYHMMDMVATKVRPENADEEIEHYKEVIEFTDSPRAHLLIAWVYYDLNDIDQARQHFKYIINNEDKLKIFDKYYEIRKDAEGALKTKEISGKSGCFIATAIYGDILAPEVVSLRQYRDSVLNCSKIGRIFIELYYHMSPSFARAISKRAALKSVIRKFILDHLLYLIRKHYTNLKS